MQELSMNILDISQNSISAQASQIEIVVSESENDNTLTISIADNGSGMTKEQVENVTDPFYTTRTTRKVGLGVPFFKMAAEMTGGSFLIKSVLGQGTVVKADFVRNHIDRMPLGDMAETMAQMICLNEGINIKYVYIFNKKEFSVETAELAEILDGLPLNTPQVMEFVRGYIKDNMDAVTE